MHGPRICGRGLRQLALREIIASIRSLRGYLGAVEGRLADLRRKVASLTGGFVAAASCADLDQAVFPHDTSPGSPHWIAGIVGSHLPELLDRFDGEFQASFLASCGGLLSLAEDDRKFNSALPAAMRCSARKLLVSFVKPIDLAQVLLSEPGSEEATTPTLRDWLDRATPRLAGCGGSKRLVVVCGRNSLDPRLRDAIERAAGQGAAIVHDAAVDFALCYEWAGISPGRALAAVLGGRDVCARIASRLHVRIDVPWQPF